MTPLLSLSPDSADIYIPDGHDWRNALSRTTHLAIGAHQDDLEFMAMHGIASCFDSTSKWFGGVTCTDGAGSARTGKYANFSDKDMQAIRAEEQREAARIGHYSFVAQLGFASAQIKDPKSNPLPQDLLKILQAAKPEVVYAHNLADKHSTHVAVVAATIQALRKLPLEDRPRQLIGCEVWRDLDWMPDSEKIIMDLSAQQTLAGRLNALFDSQINGGKRYDLAIEGRRRAHATFLNSHSADDMQSAALGMDLTPLIRDDALCPIEYVQGFIERFKETVTSQLRGVF